MITTLLWTLLWLSLGYGVFIFILKYCILRRPQPKSKRIDLDLRIPLPIPESQEKSSNEDSERWCIIGAGFSGLSMASALIQKRIPFTIYEREERLGGNWCHGVYEGVHMISSRTTTEISDFPMPEHYPIFPSAKQVLEYLESYAEHFKLNDYIQFGMEVNKIDPILDGRQWKVEFKDGQVKQYKGVIICTGHDWDKNIPKYPGNPTLEMIHSRDYKKPSQLEGKRVLIIGGGNSACDIAVDAAHSANYAGISMRRGYWILPRTMFGRAIPEVLIYWLPEWIQQLYLNIGIRVIFGKYSSFGLQDPQLTIYDHPITVSDQFLLEIKKGTIHPYKDVQRIDGKVVTFVDGRSEEFDMVVFGTGYLSTLPVVDHLTARKEGIAQFLHGIIHPKYKNLFLLGLGQSRSGCGPLLCAAAGTIVKFIDVQSKLTFPLGIVLRACGSRMKKPGRSCRDVVINPHKSFAHAWLGGKLIYTVPFWEKRLFNIKDYDPNRIASR